MQSIEPHYGRNGNGTPAGEVLGSNPSSVNIHIQRRTSWKR